MIYNKNEILTSWMGLQIEIDMKVSLLNYQMAKLQVLIASTKDNKDT